MFFKNLDKNSSLKFKNASSVKWNVILQKKTCLRCKINRIYFDLYIKTTFSLQINKVTPK